MIGLILEIGIKGYPIKILHYDIQMIVRLHHV